MQMADRDKHPEPLLAINPNTNKRLLDPGEPSNKRARPATRGPLKYLASKTSRRIRSALFEEINELSDVELSDDDDDVSSVEDLGSDLGSNSQVFDGSALKAMENMLRDIPTLSWSGAIDLDARVQASWGEALAIAEKDALSFSDDVVDNVDYEDILNPSSDDDDELLDELLALADPV